MTFKREGIRDKCMQLQCTLYLDKLTIYLTPNLGRERCYKCINCT